MPVSDVILMVKAPSTKPVGAPIKERNNVSIRINKNIFERFIPIAISIPNSFRRSNTAISIVFMIPKIRANMMMIMIRKSHDSIILSAYANSGAMLFQSFTSYSGKFVFRLL